MNNVEKILEAMNALRLEVTARQEKEGEHLDINDWVNLLFETAAKVDQAGLEVGDEVYDKNEPLLIRMDCIWYLLEFGHKEMRKVLPQHKYLFNYLDHRASLACDGCKELFKEASEK